MHPVFVTAKNLSDRDTNPFNLSDDYLTQLGEPEVIQNLHSRRWVQDNPKEYERQRLFNVQQNEGLRTVSPEFDLLTLGTAGRDLWKGLKTLRSLKTAPFSYTGVPKEYVSRFRGFKGNIYTTDDIKLAEQYSKGNFGKANDPNGRVFKIYDTGSGNGIAKIPAPSEHPYAPGKKFAYHWFRIPYDIDENGGIVKLDNPNLFRGGDQWILNYELEKPHAITTPVSNRAGIYRSADGVSVDGLIADAEYAGYRGVQIPSVVDGVYESGDQILHPAMTEIIYNGNAPGLIRASLDEPDWMTSWRNTRNMGMGLSGPATNWMFRNNSQ